MHEVQLKWRTPTLMGWSTPCQYGIVVAVYWSDDHFQTCMDGQLCPCIVAQAAEYHDDHFQTYVYYSSLTVLHYC